MAVKSTKPYVGVPRDLMQNFLGKQLVFFSWDHHMLHATPVMTCVEPAMRWSDYLEQVLKPMLAADPDLEKIDWRQVQWSKRKQPWTPNPDASLVDNGIAHKDQIRFHTPGLNSICGAAW